MPESNADLNKTRLSLIRRLKCLDDQGSWNDFFTCYWKLIYGVARKTGLSDAEAQDVVQETVLTVVRNIGGFETETRRGSFRGWLLKITRWRIGDQFRKRAPERNAPAKREGPSETSRTPTSHRIPDPASLEIDAIWEREWEQTVFDSAVEKVRGEVDAASYQMFDLHVLKELSVGRVAKKLGVKPARVYFAKYKVSRLIKKEVKRLQTKII
jgi:RNA polymerase sigma factor (sigma-70 family)